MCSLQGASWCTGYVWQATCRSFSETDLILPWIAAHPKQQRPAPTPLPSQDILLCQLPCTLTLFCPCLVSVTVHSPLPNRDDVFHCPISADCTNSKWVRKGPHCGLKVRTTVLCVVTRQRWCSLDGLPRNVSPGLVDIEVRCCRVHTVTEWLRLDRTPERSNNPVQSGLPTAGCLGLRLDGFWIYPLSAVQWGHYRGPLNNQRPTLWIQAKT